MRIYTGLPYVWSLLFSPHLMHVKTRSDVGVVLYPNNLQCLQTVIAIYIYIYIYYVVLFHVILYFGDNGIVILIC